MPYPGVTVRILDESLVVSNSELDSPTIGGFLGLPGNHSMKLFAYNGPTGTEAQQGYYYVENLADWFARLTSFYNYNYPGFSGTNGATLAARDLLTNGATAWTDEWYHVHNFLQYGAPCYVTWQDSGATMDFKYLDIDVVFSGSTGNGGTPAHNAYVSSMIDERASTPNPVFGVLAVHSGTTITGAMTVTSSPTSAQYAAAAFGEKKHFNVAGDPANLIISSLAPDVAGCIARTDRESYPWFSPAGARRGRIANAVSTTRYLSEADKSTLYGARINPIFNVPGEGILLWGDKTLYTGTSTLSGINVARLFIYLKKTIAPIARGVLFEQNDQITRNLFISAADSVLADVVAKRGISEYKIICDETNNTPEIIEAKTFVADILVKPIPSINFVRLTFTNKDLSSTL
jgi:hypothetical protein